MIGVDEATREAQRWLQQHGRGFEYRHVSTKFSDDRGWVVVFDVYVDGDIMDGPLVLLVDKMNGEVRTTYP